MVGINEIVILIIVAGILFFGGRKIPELAKAIGRFRGELKKGKKEVEEEIEEGEKEAQTETKEKPSEE